MKLYFQRHGLADWPDWNRPDAERPLTAEGRERLKVQAKTLARLGVAVDVLLSSPLVRARETAELLAERLQTQVTVDSALSPGFNAVRLHQLLTRYPDAGAVLLVGHEPDFSTCISALIGGGQVILKKGGLARVDLDSTEPLGGQLVWLLAPKLLAGD